MFSIRIKSLLILILLVTVFPDLQAQDKFGYINSQELIADSEEGKKAEAELMTMQVEIDEIYRGYLDEYNNKAQAFQKESNSISDVLRESKLEDLSTLEKRIRDFQVSSQTKIDAKKDQLYEPILQRVSEVMTEIADELRYTYIFDTSTGALIFAPPGDNLMEIAIKKLNKE